MTPLTLLLTLAACRPPQDLQATLTDPCISGEGYPYAPYDGPREPVEIRVDGWSTPHIYAANDADLFYAAGYVQARDRLFQLDTNRRAATGHLAEILGEDGLSSDQQARAIGFWYWGCRSAPDLGNVRPDDFALLEAWLSGVNRRVDEVDAGEVPRPWGMGEGELDYWPEPFTLVDIMAMGKRIQFGFANSLTNDLVYTLIQGYLTDYASIPVFQPGSPRFIMLADGDGEGDGEGDGKGNTEAEGQTPRRWSASPQEALALLEAARDLERNHGAGPASNSWAVHAEHSANGFPILANDPHAGLYDPNAVHALHMNSADAGGAFDVAGFGFVGAPGVHLGHTDALVWAATTNMADVMDLWDVQVDEAEGVVWLGGEALPLQTHDEIILVRQEDSSVEEQTLTIHRVQDYGVILPEEMLPLPESTFADGRLLFNWTGFYGGGEMLQYFDFDRAHSLDDFAAAVQWEQVGIHNWTGATANGIRYQTHGRIPDRGPVQTRPAPYAIMDGSDPDTLWSGRYLDASWLPALDGERDFIVTANNDPWGVTADNQPLDDEVYYSSFFASGFRADRIHRQLDTLIAQGPVAVEQMQTLQMDAFSQVADRLLPYLEDAMAAVNEDEELADWRDREDLQAAVARLSAWDRVLRRDTHEPALFRVFLAELERELLLDDMSFLFTAVEEAAPILVAKVTLLSLEQQIAAVLGDNPQRDLLTALDTTLAWLDEQAVNRGVRKLAVHLQGATDTRLAILFQESGKARPALKIEPLAAW